ncbi:hypothetical protein ACFFU9_07750 [Mariniflexile ostreae]|uniref:Outer membrane beta-barrel protein n=1 Tax=Mariniflexile ostreae TaxID=1520892 RepID=A0ABV5FB71_9FLAO
MKNLIITKILYIVLTLFFTLPVVAQDLENIGSRSVDKVKNSPLKINGAVSANGIYYSANTRSAREPFTYFLQGNINMSWLTFSMPLSYSFSSQGSDLDYQTPFKFNRLSIHPKYKWIQTHIGDVSMTFSPYTLNGHQFTGGGVELSPKGGFKISAMHGRLLKATEDSENQQTVPAFKRMGYGSRLAWEQDDYKIGVIGFYAKDDINSIATIPESKGVTPKENLVIGFDGEVKLAKNYTLNAEYASTAITQDLRANDLTEKGTGLAALFFKGKSSTEYFNAFKAGLNIQVDNMRVGLGYERIDPGYQTLGAYFFNNDFENITLNMSQTLFNSKLNLNFNIGYQRDNLDKRKAQETSRGVAAVNATLNVSEKIVITGSYSNFSTHTNESLNQFDDINDSDLTDEELEALNYKQLSQNANVNFNWVLANSEKNTQNVNFNYSLASSANEENGIIRVGQANNFHNGNAVYTIGFPTNELSVSTALNYNYSDIGRDDSNAYGGTLSVNKKFLDKKLNTTLGTTYNTNNNKDLVTNVLNFRANATWLVAEQHNFNVTAIQLFRNASNQQKLSEVTVTFGYVYAFDIGRPKLNFRRKIRERPTVPVVNPEKIAKVKEKKTKTFSFSYRKHTFTGEHDKITGEVTEILSTPDFKALKQVKSIVGNLSKLETELKAKENKADKSYKEAGIAYLKYLYEHKDYLNTYHELVFNGLKRLYQDAIPFDIILKEEYVDLLANINTLRLKGESVSESDLNYLKIKERKYQSHTWMQEQLKKLSYESVIDDKGSLKEFRAKNLSQIFAMLENKKSNDQVEVFLERQLADFYHKKSIEFLD